MTFQHSYTLLYIVWSLEYLTTKLNCFLFVYISLEETLIYQLYRGEEGG